MSTLTRLALALLLLVISASHAFAFDTEDADNKILANNSGTMVIGGIPFGEAHSRQELLSFLRPSILPGWPGAPPSKDAPVNAARKCRGHAAEKRA